VVGLFVFNKILLLCFRLIEFSPIWISVTDFPVRVVFCFLNEVEIFPED